MQRKAKGPGFKMEGHTLPGINQRSEGNTDLPDGRSASSVFQDRPFTKEDGANWEDMNDQHERTARHHISVE